MFKKILFCAAICVNITLAAHSENGPNHMQNAPKLSSAHQHGSRTTVKGELKSVKNSRFVIQFFSNPLNSHNKTEGLTFVGEIVVITDRNGKASFKTLLPATSFSTSYISATATRINERGHKSDTSEFSKNIKVQR